MSGAGDERSTAMGQALAHLREAEARWERVAERNGYPGRPGDAVGEHPTTDPAAVEHWADSVNAMAAYLEITELELAALDADLAAGPDEGRPCTLGDLDLDPERLGLGDEEPGS